MNKEIKERWINALRSGEYQQGRGKLHREYVEGDHRYCCLGVLCELAVADGVIPAAQRSEYGDHRYGADEAMGHLPDEVADWAGINYAGQFVTKIGEPGRLDQINDDGAPFTFLADIIEEHF